MVTTEIHKYGTDDGWHGKIEEGGQFPPEKDRYHLYNGTTPLKSLPVMSIKLYATSVAPSILFPGVRQSPLALRLPQYTS